ncbi:hypothetical protein EMIHUDRAFT_443680 [Emiliania huxleyi CCMP1516]|uniref:Transmembrane protein n=2 Tax=Emiliania huxleyi TaxID=2903 RepID=A0A0D3IP26_EMIH1|nr:hypothetical protein EMIHUDRAFT_445926 [Emiliania huxleyi CCMP1516]XP_005777747.1 hypothetical protein EMIHUDRAFT_443680 [Emiliania huxleyi CCMP1516]EOD13011.1 hypothetical protein EMIHUDRAFT_445926 [Emiliania huxleyi CCMP1516]EOD25318.1 hypothetical protein EMIHUDRAFT_443680 [Emiliania huxleyi CCMP1516]|eukprot:XP_005765440.1 hypothetical protein EMIHUDRAFT_445926 [Emiliania huxleyi CCMP1516]
MQEAGKHLERSHAMGALIANEERRLVEAVRRCDVWATVSALVLAVHVELLVGVSSDEGFDRWHQAFRTLFAIFSTASMMCMGWVAYDVLLAAEEAQAMAHDHGTTKDAVESLRAWLHLERQRSRPMLAAAEEYPPLETMITAVAYLEHCLRDLRIVFSWGLLLAAASFFCYLGTVSSAGEPPFYSGVIVVVVVAAARSVWKTRLRGTIRTRAPSARGAGMLGLGLPAPRALRRGLARGVRPTAGRSASQRGGGGSERAGGVVTGIPRDSLNLDRTSPGHADRPVTWTDIPPRRSVS